MGEGEIQAGRGGSKETLRSSQGRACVSRPGNKEFTVGCKESETAEVENYSGRYRCASQSDRVRGGKCCSGGKAETEFDQVMQVGNQLTVTVCVPRDDSHKSVVEKR